MSEQLSAETLLLVRQATALRLLAGQDVDLDTVVRQWAQADLDASEWVLVRRNAVAPADVDQAVEDYGRAVTADAIQAAHEAVAQKPLSEQAPTTQLWPGGPTAASVEQALQAQDNVAMIDKAAEATQQLSEQALQTRRNVEMINKGINPRTGQPLPGQSVTSEADRAEMRKDRRTRRTKAEMAVVRQTVQRSYGDKVMDALASDWETAHNEALVYVDSLATDAAINLSPSQVRAAVAPVVDFYRRAWEERSATNRMAAPWDPGQTLPSEQPDTPPPPPVPDVVNEVLEQPPVPDLTDDLFAQFMSQG